MVQIVTAIPAVKALNTDVIWMHGFTLAHLNYSDVLLPDIFNWSTNFTVFTFLVIIELVLVKKVQITLVTL